MRLTLLISALVCLCSCGDNIVGPNTDVGPSVWTEVSPPFLSIRDSTTVLHMKVFVGNKSDREIRVVSGGPPYVFTNNPTQTRGLWGSLRIATDTDPLHAGPSIDWWGNSVYVSPRLSRCVRRTSAHFARMEGFAAGRWPPEDIQREVRSARARGKRCVLLYALTVAGTNALSNERRS